MPHTVTHEQKMGRKQWNKEHLRVMEFFGKSV